MSAVFDHYPHGAALKLTLLCLADHANDAGGNCYPSIAAVARRTCCSESQARRNVHALIDSGYIAVEPGTEQGGSGSRRYRIHVERLTPSAGATPCMDATPSTDASRPLAPVRVTPSTHDTRTIITIKEPSLVIEQFEQLWRVYPKKVGKKAALKAFCRVRASPEGLDSMLAAIARQKASAQWLEASGKYIPHCATWISGERWKDEFPAQQERKVAW